MTSRLGQAKQAVRIGKKARIALAGPAGSGKTWTALDLARVLAPDGKVLVIDTERGSASLYSDTYAFDELDWTPPYDPRQLSDTLKEAGATYDVIVVDSLSHFWQGEGGTLDIVENTASRSASGNRFAGWKTGTPAQNHMVETMLHSAAHVIVTMRTKTEYVLEADSRGKQVPRKVGMAPVQRDGIEYEFTVTGDLDIDHRLTISKSRCHLLGDKMFQPGRASEMAETLRDWLAGAEEAPPPPPEPEPEPAAATNGKKPRVKIEKTEDAGRGCPEPDCDGKLLIVTLANSSKFIGCSNFPGCRYTERPPKSEDEAGEAPLAENTPPALEPEASTAPHTDAPDPLPAELPL